MKKFKTLLFDCQPCVRILSVAFVLVSFSLVGNCRGAVFLSDNLDRPHAGSVFVDKDYNVSQQFLTDSQSYYLTSVTLVISRAGSENANVEIWKGNSSIPTTFVGALTLSGSYSSSLANTTFDGSGITLNANSYYWVVLKSPSFETIFNWSYTSDETGNEAGFSPNWAFSSNGGIDWDGGNSYNSEDPFRMKVEASAVPEPGAYSLVVAALCAIMGVSCHFRRGKLV